MASEYDGESLEELEAKISAGFSSFDLLCMRAFPGSGNWGGDNSKTFYCFRCKEHVGVVHLMENPKCWTANQRRNKRRYNSKKWAGDYVCQPCEDCGLTIYWTGQWSLVDGFRCPKCYAKWKIDQVRLTARRRYRWKSRGPISMVITAGDLKVRVPRPLPDPTCKNCGVAFKAKRSDAKFCSPKCRVTANRAKSAKTKATKKRRPRTAK
jgi:hypothetical protein